MPKLNVKRTALLVNHYAHVVAPFAVVAAATYAIVKTSN